MNWKKLKTELLALYSEEIGCSLIEHKNLDFFAVSNRYEDTFVGNEIDFIESCWYDMDAQYVQVILYHTGDKSGYVWDCISVYMGYTLSEYIEEIKNRLKEAESYD